MTKQIIASFKILYASKVCDYNHLILLSGNHGQIVNAHDVLFDNGFEKACKAFEEKLEKAKAFVKMAQQNGLPYEIIIENDGQPKR